MRCSKEYCGIDYFRWIAAVLVIAIHTSPLAAFSEMGDFILTRVIARVAVPFFFTTSGFFLISGYRRNAEKLAAFVKKTIQLYGIAILIYIPVNIYNGYFEMQPLLPNIIRDLVFDGTMYHLWYLPASATGAVIAWYLVRGGSYRRAFAVSLLLYLLGVLGDSYYGAAEKLFGLRSFYALIFEVSDYTRNGIFFAPFFFVLGGWLADRQKRMSIEKSVAGFLLSFICMLAEALVLRCLDLQRHDSMYAFLPLLLYFLFQLLLQVQGKCRMGLRTASMLVYVIHPFMIVVLRLFAKLLHMQKIFIGNSLVHFAFVCLLSVFSAALITIVRDWLKPQGGKGRTAEERAYIEIDLKHLRHNVRVLKGAMPAACSLMAVVKAQAYGHGMYEIATQLHRLGVRAFAVATVDEAIQLRKYGISGEILILGYTSPARAKELHRYKLTQTLPDYRYAAALNRKGYMVRAHIKIDTGMHRLGFPADDAGAVSAVFSMKNIEVTGIFTHLCSADSLRKEDTAFTNRQISRFYMLLELLKEKGIPLPKLHMQSSYGFLNYPELECDYVRVGVALYGVLSSPGDKTIQRLDLKPVLSLKSRVVLLRDVCVGEGVGYGQSFVAERDSRIAVLSIGYADGIPRNLSGKGSYVLINGHRAPVIGRICMDQLTVDVTEVPGVKTGSSAVLIGRDGKEEITAPMVADWAESITNELLSRMGQRLGVVCRY